MVVLEVALPSWMRRRRRFVLPATFYDFDRNEMMGVEAWKELRAE